MLTFSHYNLVPITGKNPYGLVPVLVLREDYDGPYALCDRAASSESTQAEKLAGSEASMYGAQAQSERAPLMRYDIQNLLNPQGFGQQGEAKMLTAAEAGAGGSSSSIVGAEDLAAKRGTTGTNSALLDAVARSRSQAGAGASEKIAAANEQVKLGQQGEAAGSLQGLYGTDVGAQLGQGNLQNSEINTQIKAGQSGWFQNLMQGIQTTSEAFKNVAGGIAAMGCWVASAVFEEDIVSGPRVNLVRDWMYRNMPEFVLSLYRKHGQWVASKPLLVRALAPAFNWMLEKAIWE